MVFSFEISIVSGSIEGRIYKNGVAVGTTHLNASSSFISYTDELTFASGELVQLYIRRVSGVNPGQTRNFAINYDINLDDIDGTVTLP